MIIFYLFIIIIIIILIFSIYVGVEFLTFNCNAQLKILILIIAQYKSINYNYYYYFIKVHGINTRLHAAGILILISSFFCCFERLLSLCNIRFWFFGPYFQSLLEMRRQLKTHQAIRINLKNSFIPTPPFRLNLIP